MFWWKFFDVCIGSHLFSHNYRRTLRLCSITLMWQRFRSCFEVFCSMFDCGGHFVPKNGKLSNIRATFLKTNSGIYFFVIFDFLYPPFMTLFWNFPKSAWPNRLPIPDAHGYTSLGLFWLDILPADCVWRPWLHFDVSKMFDAKRLQVSYAKFCNNCYIFFLIFCVLDSLIETSSYVQIFF